MSDESPYSKPVEQILTISNLALNEAISSTRSLAVRGGIPPSSGYRVVKAMESREFITRDQCGHFVRGSESLRVALCAWGLGALYPSSFAILRQLQMDTGRTAFLAILENSKLHIGPVQLAPQFHAGADQAMPAVYAVLSHHSTAVSENLIEASVASEQHYAVSGGDVTSTVKVVFVEICDAINQAKAVIGVVMSAAARADYSVLNECVNTAAQRMQSCQHDKGIYHR